MTIDPKARSISSLRRYSRTSPGGQDDHINAFVELDGESDRAAVILTTTNLEDFLETAIRAVMVEHDEASELYKALFMGQGPLASFSSKINLSYALKLMSERAARECHIIREIRNACAHSKRPISFDTPELYAVLRLLVKDEPALIPLMDPKIGIDYPKARRHNFVGKCLVIQYEMTMGERPTSPDQLNEMFR